MKENTHQHKLSDCNAGKTADKNHTCHINPEKSTGQKIPEGSHAAAVQDVRQIAGSGNYRKEKPEPQNSRGDPS
ncbi:MAG: hypothetical protein LUQ31_02475 [Methanoregula sp.]|nr:hypothetical protein [Methanoregula sp.]